MDEDELRSCWDEHKAASNLEKHSVSFEAAADVFNDPMRVEEEDTFAEGEYRHIVVGQVDGRLLTVVYSCPEDDVYRIISARRSTPHERKTYEQNLFHP